MMFDPAATATYCLLSNMYVIGDAFHNALVWKLQSAFPVAASAAIKAPLSSPKITTPPAVLSTPPHEFTAPVCGNVQAALPVRMSIARSRRCAGSGAGANDPPMNPLPASQSAGTLV